MIILLSTIFIIGYLFITIENITKVNKAAIALLTGVVCWTVFIISTTDKNFVIDKLSLQISSISQILFFLLGAMTIVEMIDSHKGFDIIVNMIKVNSMRGLLWVIGFITFFLSAVLDNLTTTIVMVTLLRKIVKDKKERMIFAGIIIIAANAGGCWTPIGDVTTTMLWIVGRVTSLNIMIKLIVPAIITLVIPLLMVMEKIKGPIIYKEIKEETDSKLKFQSRVILIIGLLALCFIPMFKTMTGLPPFMGMLISLGVIWAFTEIIHRGKDGEEKMKYSVSGALRKIDTTSILFFLGILLSIGALEETHVLSNVANYLSKNISNYRILVTIIGIISSIVDNIPLVAGTIGMYGLQIYPVDHNFWELLAYSTGTGGSILIIGSAAGVVAMGMENIKFVWYLKHISIWALAGFLGGTLTYIIFNA